MMKQQIKDVTQEIRIDNKCDTGDETPNACDASDKYITRCDMSSTQNNIFGVTCQITLAAHGLEELFFSCAVVSVFGSGGKQVLVLHTYVLRVQYSCGVVLVFWFWQEIVFGVSIYRLTVTIVSQKNQELSLQVEISE